MGAVTTQPGALPDPAVQSDSEILLRPFAFGLLGALALLGVYLGLLTLAQGWTHALRQLAEDGWMIGAITAGFGAQVGLFTYLRRLQAHAAIGGVAVSTGTSTTAMVACCAHHLADVLPVLGLSGAAIVLNAYRSPLLWLGVVMNLAGVAYLLLRISQQRRSARTRLAAPR